MQRLPSALFWSCLAFSLVVSWITVAPFDPRRRLSHWYAITWANHCIRLFGASRIHILARERLLGDRSCVLVANRVRELLVADLRAPRAVRPRP